MLNAGTTDILKDVPRWLTAAPFESCEVPLVFWINETRDVVVANCMFHSRFFLCLWSLSSEAAGLPLFLVF